MQQPSDSAVSPEKVSRYAWYVGWMMMLVTVISMLDRKALTMLAEPVKRDLGLSDTQLGLLTGGLFSLVYAVGSFPLARLADRYSRTRIIGVCLVIWSFLTAGGGLATGFYTLAVSRVGVALGESGATPASHALLTNYFPPSARGRAYSLILAGAPLGILFGLALGGILSDMFEWRTALIVMGLPGALVGIVVMMTVRDIAVPRRTGASGSFARTVKHILGDGVLRNLLGGATVMFLAIGATNALFPAYIMRHFGASASEVGLGYGVTLGVSGFTGSLLGGWLSDRIGLGSPARPLRLFAYALPVIDAIAITRLLVDDYHLVLGLVGIETLFTTMYAGATYTALQARVGDEQRAMATAVMLFGINGIGSSLGPVIAGMISDRNVLAGASSAEALQIGLLWVVPAFFVASLFYFRAAGIYGREEEARLAVAEAVELSVAPASAF